MYRQGKQNINLVQVTCVNFRFFKYNQKEKDSLPPEVPSTGWYPRLLILNSITDLGIHFGLKTVEGIYVEK